MQNSFPSGSVIVTPPPGRGSLARLPPERHDLADCLIDVGNDEVEVTSVLHHLSFGDLLQLEECRRAERIDGEPPFFTPERSGIFSDQRAPKSSFPLNVAHIQYDRAGLQDHSRGDLWRAGRS